MKTSRTEELPTWGATWPRTLTLGDAADLIGFDLYADDDPDTELTRTTVPTDEIGFLYTREYLEDNDAEDRFTPLQTGFDTGAHEVPPVVVLPGEGLRDGAHRTALAVERGCTHVSAYVAAPHARATGTGRQS
ncbi:hypothetical protein OG215_37825 (plasmid) [Streptomyces globisporus]|uniref:hypothetical protein n=1 Tax=Streptomyces globisporus TaxID=1908 RepID=UPI002F9136DA|nr:hypothetical protein OG215_37825 [Streptomyces globisporus]